SHYQSGVEKAAAVNNRRIICLQRRLLLTTGRQQVRTLLGLPLRVAKSAHSHRLLLKTYIEVNLTFESSFVASQRPSIIHQLST
ncbi:hypothetical protein L9F63_022441, partial [Diploptera punctata]